MKKNAFTLILAVATVLLTGTVSAAPCVWGVDGTESTSVQTQVGSTVVVTVVVDNKSEFTAPADFTTTWSPGNCYGRDKATCGLWTASKKFNSAGSSTAHFSVASGACDGPRVWDVSITVTADDAEEAAAPAAPTGAQWTEEEKTEVVDHSRSPHASGNAGQSVQGHIGLLWTPNMTTTTRDTWGVEGFLGALVTPHLRLGGALRYAQTGIPVEERLNPVVWQLTETQYGAAFRITGVITPADWVAIDLGGQLGGLVLHYPTAMIRQLQNGSTESVLEETQVTPTAGILGQVSFYPGSSGFMVGIEAGCDLTLTEVRRRAGSGYGGTGLDDPGANEHVYAFPAFGLIVGGRF